MKLTSLRSFSFLSLALLLFCFVTTQAPLRAQTTSASVSGVVGDQTGARIPGARIVLVEQNSKSTRNTVANSEGIYNFAGLPPGTYVMTVKYPGFETFIEKGILLHPGDTAELVAVAMKIGQQEISVTVDAPEIESSNGEISSLISAEDIKHLSTEGRDVTELVKILPGFALQPGGSSNYGLSNAAPDNEVVGPGGSLGNYAANGAPANGVGLISDGANVQDPGTGGATTQSINMDMVEEVKVSTSNFGADTAKGPVVINAVGKAGGQSYHGDVYVIGRTSQLNAQDWLVKNQGLPKPRDRFIYPGFQIGGPVFVPGTNFNRNKKLLFIVSGEDYVQRNVFMGGSGASALRLSTVPTNCMLGLADNAYTTCNPANKGMADFSQASLGQLFNVDPAKLLADCTNPGSPGVAAGTLYSFVNFCQGLPAGLKTPQGDSVSATGAFPVADIDPGSAVYLSQIFPRQNRIAQPVLGTNQESDGFNRSDLYLTNNDLYQLRARVDFNFSQSSKFYAVYNTERGQSYNPFSLYGGAPSGPNGALPAKSIIVSGVNSQTASGNFVHVFSPSLTSETFVAASYYLNTFNPKNQASETRAALGYPYQSIVANGSQQIPQLGYGPTGGSGIPLYTVPDFSFGQSFSRKISLDAGENVSKVWRQHTFKVGFYYERIANNQLTGSAATQGNIAEYGTYVSFLTAGGGRSTPNNTIADFLFGATAYFGQSTNSIITDLNYTAIDGYVTDSWKATRRITLDLGVRLDHLGPWTDPHGIGPAFWYPDKYVTPANAYTTGITKAQFPGIDWHGRNSSISDAVQPARWAFPSPRVGFAFDAYGTGRTIFTGGAGLYRSHDTYNNFTGPLGTAQGSFTAYFNNITLACADALGRGITNPLCPTGTVNSGNNFTAASNVGISVLDPKDDQQPLTTTYSLGVNQSIRTFGNLIVNYVGNRSQHLLLDNTFGGNINTIPLGGLYGPDPNPLNVGGYGTISASPDSIGNTAGGPLVDDYRPYPFYSNINLLRHALSSNYNALQVTISNTRGRLHYNVNYTWSKALGYRGANGNGGVPDATNTRNDYGIAAFDRTQALNASYTYIEGKAFHVDNRIVSGFVNNWEISGITNLQSGPNIQAAYSNNFQLTSVYSTAVGSLPPTDNKTYLGTPDVFLQPIMTCDPSAHLHSGQFINASCLTLGPAGVNGPFRYPYLRGPAFFNSDLSVQKSFHFHERRELVFRYSAFNFLNHPLTSLVAATASPLRLVISGPGSPPNSAFGISDYKQGRRVSEVTIRFNF